MEVPFNTSRLLPPTSNMTLLHTTCIYKIFFLLQFLALRGMQGEGGSQRHALGLLMDVLHLHCLMSCSLMCHRAVQPQELWLMQVWPGLLPVLFASLHS